MTTRDESDAVDPARTDLPAAEASDGARAPQRWLRRRRLLLGWSAPVVLAMILAGCLLLGTAGGNLLGRQHYDAMRYPEAASQFQAQQRWPDVVEPWKARFNSGTAWYRADEYFRATEDLRAALATVPVAGPAQDAPADSKDPQAPECRVRTNLSLAVEAMGDGATDEGDHAMAGEHYAEARELLDVCTAAQQNRDSADRLQNKEDEAREDDQQPTEAPSQEPTEQPSTDPTEPPTPDPSDEPSDEPTATTEPTDDPQREELEERNREAERERQEEQQRDGGGYGGGQNW